MSEIGGVSNGLQFFSPHEHAYYQKAADGNVQCAFP